MASPSDAGTSFAGSVPRVYESRLVPLIFEPYALDLARRLATRAPSRVLEIACGTGVVTRALASALPGDTSIVATDLSPAMLGQAAASGVGRKVEWGIADAMHLPFRDGAFDAVVCQFGAMFFPDKPKAFSEAFRVLGAGGRFLFNVWDRIEENEFADTVTMALASVFPADPPRFLARVPHGYHDRGIIGQDLAKGGFGQPARIETIAARSRAESAQAVAIAYCQGTPLKNEIEQRDSSKLGLATDAAAQAIAAGFGSNAIEGRIQAHVITVEK
jgi:SAM-dependent methyltransferase